MSESTPPLHDDEQRPPWHVHYSKTKQREYYYDPVSQESVWILPAHARRVTDLRCEKESNSTPYSQKRFLLGGALILFSLWLSSHHCRQTLLDMLSGSTMLERIHLTQSTVETTNTDVEAAEIVDRFPRSWTKVLEKEIPHDQELERLTRNIEAALQSSEDLLKQILADAKEAGMDIQLLT